MLGFAIVDAQAEGNATAVWLTSHLEGSRVNHTNAVVIQRDDARHDKRVWNLTADRAVVLTAGTTPPKWFAHSITLAAFDSLLVETVVYRERIVDAVADYAKRTKNKNLSSPAFATTRPELRLDARDEPQYRALTTANYVLDAWTAWLSTDEQRVRRTVDPRTGKSPWIMPKELGSPTLAEFPPDFGQLVKPEPLVRPVWAS
jgi:hypothetical protein